MDDIAQCRRFDQQNARELCGLQLRCVAMLCLCVFDLAVHSRAISYVVATGLWPCHELLLRRNASSVPSVGGTSRITSSRLFPDRSKRSRPPADSQPEFM